MLPFTNQLCNGKLFLFKKTGLTKLISYNQNKNCNNNNNNDIKQCGVSTVNSDKNSMRKIFLLIFIGAVIVLQAQVSTPNGGFENWTTTTCSYPENYPFNSNLDGLEQGQRKDFPITKTTGYHGNYGVQITSTSEMGYFLNYQPAYDKSPFTWHGGIPYSQKPSGIRGYYKYNAVIGANAHIFVVFSKNGNNIGTYDISLSGLHTDYTLFDINFNPPLTQTPDSVIIAVASSWPNAVAGNTLTLDSLTFKGVSAQPALMNGDFEEWTDVSLDFTDNWYPTNQSFTAVKKTTDAYNGNYAAELKTYLGERNNQPTALASKFMSGYYDNNCSGECEPIGGSPFSNQSDVLEFYYKYIPAGTDNATVWLYFKRKEGWGDWLKGPNLYATSTYKYIEVPFNLPYVPDSVVIQFQSSFYETPSISNIGSTLIIDEVVFRSQKAVSKTFNLTAGTLSTALTSNELNTVTNLTLTGTIDARDFKTMRDLMPALLAIDLSDANIVEYTGMEGTYDATNRTYRTNTIPRNGLINKIILKNILLPNSLTVIGYNAFRNCTSLNNISIPTSVNIIDISAFRGCISLSQVEIPSSVTDIKYAAFSESGLSQITFNEGLITIGEFAFSHCFSLSGNINIPASVTQIGNVAFLASNVYFNVNPSNLNYSSDNGILYDKNKTILIYCPGSFSGNFNIPSTVNTIDVDAFYNCHQITNINLPASLTTIREWAFENCTGLTTITIPSGVTMIKGYAFYKCSGLTSIYANPTTPVDLSASDSVFKHINVVECKLYVPVGSKSIYQNAVQWKDFQNIIEEDNTVDLTNGLIAFYPFNGNANDESGNSNDGTVYGASLTEDRFGIANRAFHFNGSSDYITIDGIIDDLFNKDSYSVTGWFKMNDKSHRGTIFSVNREKEIVNGQNISMITWADNLTYYGDYMSEVQYYDTSFDNNIWYFFSFTFTKNQVSHLYVDNNLLHQTFINNMDITMTSKASIGQEWDNGFNGSAYFTMISDLFFGKIDDIRVYNRILNSSERNMLYFENTTGIHNMKNTQISIFPNPADNGFYLPTNVSVDNFSIYDIRGALVLRALNANNYVDVSKLQKGIYIVQLQAKEGIYQVKLIKK